MPVEPPAPRLPSLNALRAFEAAARCGSFTRAAAELGVTAGAVTQQIRQLEAWLGFPLFERLPQGVRLTVASQAALPDLTRGFATLSEAVAQLRARQGARALRIAALPCIAQLWLSPRLVALQQAFPGLEFAVSAMEEPPDGRRALHDLALFYQPLQEGAAGSDGLTPVCAPALAKSLADPAALSGVTLLHDAVWHGDWARWLNVAGASGVDAGRGPAFSLYSLALDAALAGSGVLIGRISLVAPHLADGRLVAPFDRVLPTGDRLSVMPVAGGRAHPLRDAVAEWLGAADRQISAPQSAARI